MKNKIISIKNIIGILSVTACLFWFIMGIFLTTKRLGFMPYIFILISIITLVYLFKTKFYIVNKVEVSNRLWYICLIIAGNLFYIKFIFMLLNINELNDSDGIMLLFGMLVSIALPIYYLAINEWLKIKK